MEVVGKSKLTMWAKLGVVGLVLALMLCLAGCSSSGDTSSGDSTSSDSSGTSTETTQEAEQAEAADDAEYTVTIDSCRLAKDYEDKDVAVITYTFTNNSDDATSFAVAISSKVFQNGVQLDTAIGSDWDSNKYLSEIKKGATITVELAYVLEDTSDITVECEELFNWGDDLLAEKTFQVS